MMKKRLTKRAIVVIAVLLIGAMTLLSGCQAASAANHAGETAASAGTQTDVLQTGASASEIDASEVFTDRDLEQEPDLTNAVCKTVEDGQTLTITEEGVYVISGTASEAQIVVEAADTAKVQIVLDGAAITNTGIPCIYVKSADKVFVTTAGGSENALTVAGTFTADGDTNTDAVIFSKDDLVLNGTGTLTIESSDHGIVSKDDLKITGGTYEISAGSKAFEANDSIRIADGVFNLTAGTDGFHAENDDDDSLGYIYICGGQIQMEVKDDGLHALSVVQIDGGTLNITAPEGIEGTYIQINGGTLDISATDDGMNAARKSGAYTPTLEINDGEITVSMASGDTDAIDSNGDIIVNGGTVNVVGTSSFDYDGTGQLNGGTVIVNGEQVDALPNQK